MAMEPDDSSHGLRSQLAFSPASHPHSGTMGQTLNIEPKVGFIQHWGLYAKRVEFFCCMVMNNLVLSLHDTGFVPGMLLFLSLKYHLNISQLFLLHLYSPILAQVEFLPMLVSWLSSIPGCCTQRDDSAVLKTKQCLCSLPPQHILHSFIPRMS